MSKVSFMNIFQSLQYLIWYNNMSVYCINNYNLFTCSKKSHMTTRDRLIFASSLLSQSLSVPLSHHSVKMKKHRGSEYQPTCVALPDKDDCPNLKQNLHITYVNIPCCEYCITCFSLPTIHTILAILDI